MSHTLLNQFAFYMCAPMNGRKVKMVFVGRLNHGAGLPGWPSLRVLNIIHSDVLRCVVLLRLRAESDSLKLLLGPLVIF